MKIIIKMQLLSRKEKNNVEQVSRRKKQYVTCFRKKKINIKNFPEDKIKFKCENYEIIN